MTALSKFDCYEQAADWCEANADAIVSIVVRYFPSHYEYTPGKGLLYVPPPICWIGPNAPQWVHQANDAHFAWRDRWGFRLYQGCGGPYA